MEAPVATAVPSTGDARSTAVEAPAPLLVEPQPAPAVEVGTIASRSPEWSAAAVIGVVSVVSPAAGKTRGKVKEVAPASIAPPRSAIEPAEPEAVTSVLGVVGPVSPSAPAQTPAAPEPVAREPVPPVPTTALPPLPAAQVPGVKIPDVVFPAAPAPAARVLKRPPLVPYWAMWSAVGVLVVGLLIALLVVVRGQALDVTVPQLTGMRPDSARAKAEEVGLRFRVGDRRFSASAPPGTVIDQTPRAGAHVEEGAEIVVAVSAGSETFSMPDVVGKSIDEAKRVLQERGLGVDVTTAGSDRPAGTVIDSDPKSGAVVQTGDSVKLTVAAGGAADNVLLSTNMTGLTFVMDPDPAAQTSGTDPTMDIGRRLEALLRASGAQVVFTRTSSQAAGATASERLRVAKESSATALIGLSVTQTGDSGLAVISVPGTTSTESVYLKSVQLSTAVSDGLKKQFSAVLTLTGDGDALLTGAGVPGVRVRLGNVQMSADQANLADAQWAESVSKAVYTAISSVYGTK